MKRRFGVRLDPFTELHPLLGSKEGIAHLAMALLDPGDVAIVPEPGYAVYEGGTRLAGAPPPPPPPPPRPPPPPPPPGLPPPGRPPPPPRSLNPPHNPPPPRPAPAPPH